MALGAPTRSALGLVFIAAMSACTIKATGVSIPATSLHATQWPWGRIACIAAFVLLAVATFAATMTWGIGYDEEQYIAAGYFARSLHVYRDFIAFQPPFYTWFLATVFDVVGGWYLLAARVVTWLSAFASCLLLFSLLVTFGAGRLVGVALVVAFVTSPFSQIPMAMTRNDIMPLLLMLTSLRLFVDANRKISGSGYRLAFSGLAAALACSTKYSYLFVGPCLFIALACDELAGYSQRAGARWRRSLAFVAGMAVGLLPIAYAIGEYGNRFTFLTLGFHLTAVIEWYQSQGVGRILTLDYKLKNFAYMSIRGGNAALLTIFVAAIATVLLKARNQWREWLHPVPMALFMLFATGLAIAIKVGPHPMYYVPVAAVGALIAGHAYGVVQSAIPRLATAAALLVGFIPVTPVLSQYQTMIATSSKVGEWTGVQVHESARRIARLIAHAGLSGHIATLFPSVVLDTNVVRPEFAAGPFFFRSADLFPMQRVVELHGVGPATLDTVFANSPPVAIVAGFDGFPFQWKPPMDSALVDYAHRHGYRLVASDLTVNGYRNGQVWLRAR